MAKMGPPSSFTWEAYRAALEVFANDKPARLAAEAASVEAGRNISESTLWRWISRDDDTWREYARAKITAGHAAYAEICEIEKQLRNKELDAHSARVLIDSIKWRAGKLAPSVYGDRVQLEHSGTIQTKVVSDAPDWIQSAVEAEPDLIDITPESEAIN